MGYVWRDASPTDHVCVTGATRAQVLADNAVKASRWVNGAYGPHTCVNGYVWREAFGGDDVCVSGTQRSQARADNAAAASRRDSVTVSHDSYWGDGDPVSRQFFFVAHVNPGPVRFEVHRLDGSLAVAWSSTSYPYPPIGGAICGLSSGLPTAYGAPNAYLRVIDQVSGRHSDIAITVVLPTGAAQENTFTCMA
jgi:hypothetical protein